MLFKCEIFGDISLKYILALYGKCAFPIRVMFHGVDHV